MARRLFTQAERAYAERSVDPTQRLAARFAERSLHGLAIRHLLEQISAGLNGVSAIDANSLANKAVCRALGYRASVRFAMHVYGDPLVRKMP